MGAKIYLKKNNILVNGEKSKLYPINITTEPYPGFPTDLQAQIMSLLTTVKGNSTIQEKVFEKR